MPPTHARATIAAAPAVAYRPLHDSADLDAAQRVLRAIWGAGATALPSSELLRAFSHAGNPVLGACDEGEVVGVCVGFLAPSDGLHLHSHITGVVPSHQHLGIGAGLKRAERDWCIANGVDLVVWTFDPLLARNAHVNMRKLGATSHRLLPSFYGDMDDDINAGDTSDRLEVRWAVRSAHVEAALAGRAEDAVSRAVEARVSLPADYAALRRSDPAAAAVARATVREQLLDAFARGLEIVDFDRNAGYVLVSAAR